MTNNPVSMHYYNAQQKSLKSRLKKSILTTYSSFCKNVCKMSFNEKRNHLRMAKTFKCRDVQCTVTPIHNFLLFYKKHMFKRQPELS